MIDNKNKVLHERLLINGDWVEGSGEIKVINPANTEEIVGWIARGSQEDVDKAVKAAKEAFPKWSAIPSAQRAEILNKAAHRILETIQQRAMLLTRENGKVISESFIDFGFAAHLMEYYATLANRLKDELVIDDSLGQAYLQRRPKGVIAGIVPWNYPIVLSFFKIAPALLAGNTLVIKPATYAPLALIDAIRVLNSFLPKGVINVVTGNGAEVGSYLARHPDVSMVAFTGGIDVGKEVMKGASSGIKKVLLELGGNDPGIVLDDFNINDDALMTRLLRGVFNHTGQICFGLKRIYVPDSLYDRFTKRFTEMADALVLGNGLDPKTTLGPLNNEPGLKFIQELVNESASSGAKVTSVGQVQDVEIFKQGYFHKPTIISNVANSARIVQVEQFGPVIPIVRYQSLDEAIKMANDSAFGLGSSIWTNDLERGLKAAGQISAGQTFINSHEPFSLDLQLPFGGVKESGIGRAMSTYGLDEYVDFHTISNRYQQPQQ